MADGKKYDNGKPMTGMMLSDFSKALTEVAKVSTYGCQKYGTPSGWKQVKDAVRRYRDAKCRHMLYGATTLLDEESGLLHMAHEAWNALAVLELELTKREQSKDLETVLETTGTVH